jgi:Domain of unknown function (DUF4331)
MRPVHPAFGALVAVTALAVTAVLYDVSAVRGSDHQDSPAVLARPAADITDVFVFPDPNDATKVVFEMNVDPLLIPGAATTSAALDPSVLYQFKIAHGAQAGAEDMVIQFLAAGSGPAQTIGVYGPAAPAAPGTISTTVGAPQNVAFNKATVLANGAQVFVGPRTDPFAFDLAQFFKIIPDRNAAFQPNPPAPSASSFRGFSAAFNAAKGTNCEVTPSSDFLAAGSYNVLAIVFEAPKSLIAPASGSQMIHVWTTSSTPSGS